MFEKRPKYVGNDVDLWEMSRICNNNNNNVYLLSAVPQSQTGLTALYNEIKAGHNNELSKIKMNLK